MDTTVKLSYVLTRIKTEMDFLQKCIDERKRFLNAAEFTQEILDQARSLQYVEIRYSALEDLLQAFEYEAKLKEVGTTNE